MIHIEHRYADIGDVQGRTLSGVVVSYGDVARIRHPMTGELVDERIESGAFGTIGDVRMNVQHDRGRIIARTGSGLSLTNSDTELRLTAQLPETREAEDTLELVRTGVLRGLSAEFVTRRERRDQGVRVIQRARLVGVGVVDDGAYPNSTVEARNRPGGALSGTIPYDTPLDCQCVTGDCNRVSFGPDAFGLDQDDAQEVLAVVGDYANAVGSRKRGTLIVEDTGDGVSWELVSLPDTSFARDVVEQAKAAPVYGRPVFIAEEQVDENGIARIVKARLRAITIGATDADGGWDPATVIGMDRVDDLRAEPSGRTERRRLWR